MSGEIAIRFATTEDCPLLLRLIRELAAYERAPDAVVASEADLRRHGFGPDRQFEAILAFLDGEPAAVEEDRPWQVEALRLARPETARHRRRATSASVA